MESQRHNLWVLIERDDSSGTSWVAHCLDWDVVTFGRTLREALELAVELVVDTAVEDLRTGHVRSPAPDDDWRRLRSVQERGAFKATLDLLTNPHAGDGVAALATQVSVEIAEAAPQLLPTTWAAEPVALAS